MDTPNRDESYVSLFSALVGELKTRQKQFLVMQLAEILAKRAIAEASQSRTADDVAQIAAQLIRSIPAPPPNKPVMRMKGTARRRVSSRDNQEIEGAKMAIRLVFESWRALKPGTNWHALFAQKMIRQYRCIAEERIIEGWALEWEIEARLATSADLLSNHPRASQTNALEL